MSRAEERAKAYEEGLDYYHCMNDWPSIAYRAGYEQAEKDLSWHSVDEALPPMDKEVIVLLGEWNEVRIEPLYRIAFGHVVNKEYCEDFSGWNIPGVSFWMPMPEIPKEEKK